MLVVVFCSKLLQTSLTHSPGFKLYLILLGNHLMHSSFVLGDIGYADKLVAVQTFGFMGNHTNIIWAILSWGVNENEIKHIKVNEQLRNRIEN